MVRGINRQEIFMADAEKSEYLKRLQSIRLDSDVRLYAYCLMDNHAHLLLAEAEEGESLPKLMLKLNSGYAVWYNRRHKRLGTLFQERYRSEVITSNEHLLAVARYIHQNPMKIGRSISHWTSYADYLSGEGITDTDIILSFFAAEVPAARKLFSDFMKDDCPIEDERLRLDLIEQERADRHTETSVDEVLGQGNARRLICLAKPQRNEQLRRLKNAGFSLRQIESATGISRSVIARA
jgi:REP element-mobilizing transposase RayT